MMTLTGTQSSYGPSRIQLVTTGLILAVWMVVCFLKLRVAVRERSTAATSAPAAGVVAGGAPRVSVVPCDARLLESAQRMRYEVYCEELQRSSPYADHERKVLRDRLDEFGQTFVALEGDEIVGTLRANLASAGDLGVLEERYGMKASRNHPARSMVCTKLIVKQSKRGGPASVQLIAAMARYALEHCVADCFIDCIPALQPFYQRLGFEQSGPSFFHEENGPSVPMRLDVTRFGPELAARSAA